MSETTAKKICSRCGCELKLHSASYPMGSPLFSERFYVDIFSCPNCGKVELYAAQSELVTCPVCGATHPAKEKCVNCALNVAFGGREN